MDRTKVLSFLLAVCLSFAAAAQDTAPNKKDANGKKQGHWIKLDENGKKVYDGNFVNDVPTGKFTYYYPTGETKVVSVFSKNGTICRTKMYAAGGTIMGEGKYVNEQKDSVWKFYDDSGALLSQDNYVNGQKNGSCKVFYRNGQVADDRTWKNGVLNGPRLDYFEEGSIKYKGQYVDGKVEGHVTYYHPSGGVDAEGVYVNDLKEGPWKYYEENGKLKRTDTYKNGTLTNTTEDVIPKEQIEKEKKQYQDFEIKDPYQDSPN